MGILEEAVKTVPALVVLVITVLVMLKIFVYYLDKRDARLDSIAKTCHEHSERYMKQYAEVTERNSKILDETLRMLGQINGKL